MSQNDFTIANQTFPNTRADINSALQALASTSSGSSAPSTTFANQFFYNTTSNLLQIRNEDNDTFITIANLDQTSDNVEYFQSTAIRLARIEFEDGDDALTIADGGGVKVHTSLDMDGTELILDADADTSITADTDDRIDVKVGNTDVAYITNNIIGAIINRMNAKPIIINGAMEIWQRGTSLASSSGNYASDRFWYVGTGLTSTRSTNRPAGTGINYSNKLTYGSASASIGQAIELEDAGQQGIFVAGQKITVAFYGRVDSGTEAVTVAPSFRNAKFSGTNLTSFSPSTSAVTLTTDWQRFVISFTIPTINSNNTLLLLEIVDIAKTAYITGVQLELGEYDATTIPPFQHESFGDSLQRCQRYFQTIDASRANTGSLGHVESSIVQTLLPLAVKPRILAQYQGEGTLTKVGDIAINSFPSGGNTVTGIHNWVVMGNSLMFGMTTSESIVNGSSEPVRYGASNGQRIFTLDTEL